MAKIYASKTSEIQKYEVEHENEVRRLAGECMVHGRWIISEFFVVRHKRHLCDSFCENEAFMHGAADFLRIR